MSERPEVAVPTRESWRAWLTENAAGSSGCWGVTWRKGSGGPLVPYGDLVEEALCVGWVDSRPRKVDDERTALLFTPRKVGSGWFRPNKERIARLQAAGLMQPAGLPVVSAAKADGSWSKLDAVEDLLEPDPLRKALDAQPAARAAWDGFPRSARRALLEWIAQAKRPETVRARIDETVAAAARGERANQWRPKP